MKDPAMPTPMVMGMLIGSRPGRASRASAPMMRPSTARTMRNAIRLISLLYPFRVMSFLFDQGQTAHAALSEVEHVARAEDAGGIPGPLDGAQRADVGSGERARRARGVGEEVQEGPAR